MNSRSLGDCFHIYSIPNDILDDKQLKKLVLVYQDMVLSVSHVISIGIWVSIYMLVFTWNLLSCYRLARVILPIPSKRKGLVENFWELRLTFVLEQIHLVRYGSSSFFCFHVLVGCSAFLMMNNITHLIWQACFILSFFQWILFFLMFLSSL
jgi:hypothetical protein